MFTGDVDSSPKQDVSRESLSKGQALLSLTGNDFEIQVGKSSPQLWYSKLNAIIRKHIQSTNLYDFELVIEAILEEKDDSNSKELEETEKVFLLDLSMNLRKYADMKHDVVVFEWNSLTLNDVIYRYKVSKKKYSHLCDLFEFTAIQCIYEKYFKHESSNISEEEIRNWYASQLKENASPPRINLNDVNQMTKSSPKPTNLTREDKDLIMNYYKSTKFHSNLMGNTKLLFTMIADLFIFNSSSYEFVIFSRSVNVSLHSSPDFICKLVLINPSFL
jgi:hypothetical protein